MTDISEPIDQFDDIPEFNASFICKNVALIITVARCRDQNVNSSVDDLKSFDSVRLGAKLDVMGDVLGDIPDKNVSVLGADDDVIFVEEHFLEPFIVREQHFLLIRVEFEFTDRLVVQKVDGLLIWAK